MIVTNGSRSEPGVLGLVRDATRERHAWLEAMPSQVRLLRDDYEIAEYRWLLQRLYGFYRPLQSQLAAFAHAGDWGARIAERTLLLERDLRMLGLPPVELANTALCERVPAVDSSDRALGCAYVLEGSTLGGRVIAKHLARVFRDRTDIPYGFFTGDGERTAERFRAWCGALEAEAADAHEICRSACATFDAIANWLADPIDGCVERCVG